MKKESETALLKLVHCTHCGCSNNCALRQRFACEKPLLVLPSAGAHTATPPHLGEEPANKLEVLDGEC